jgi:hypothetical protein
MNLPKPVAEAIGPLFELLPLDRAMDRLVVDHPPVPPAPPAPPGNEAAELVERIVKAPAIGPDSHLAAGLWLYVDDLHRSHRISQQHEDATGSFWHGIMHRREGDFGNSFFWFRKAADHPAMARIKGYDPGAFIDEVEAATQRGEAPAALIDLQRREWCALFEHCAAT